MKENILILSPQLPSNPNGGARILQDRFKLLSKYYNLFMLARDRNKKASKIEYLKELFIIKKTKPINFLMFFYRYFIVSLFLMYYLIIKNKIKIVQLEFYDSLIYSLFLFPFRLLGVKIFYTVIDIECLYYPRNSIKFRFTKNIEHILLKNFIDNIFVWGKDDREELIRWGLEENKIKIIPPIISTIKGNKWQFNKDFNFVFMGSINHSPNRDSLNYILKNLWPKIIKILSKSRLYLILGSNKVSPEMKDKSIINCGFVKDPEAILKNCNLFLAPIISGTGIKIKIIESFSFGIPLISTPLGFRNFDDLDRKRILIAENTEHFINKIRRVSKNPPQLKKISEYQKEYFNKHFTENNIKLYLKYYSA